MQKDGTTFPTWYKCLSEYSIPVSEGLDSFGLNTGYLVNCCFNKNKQSEIKEVTFGNKNIYETII